MRRTDDMIQCSGISPTQSTPGGLSFGNGFSPAARAASGGRPRVTVCEIRALRFSKSLSIRPHFRVTSRSSLVVVVSRKSAILHCSLIRGRGIKKFFAKSGETRFWPADPYISDSPNILNGSEIVR